MSKLSSGFAEEQIAEIKKVFSVVDKDGNGSINAKELGGVLRSLGGGSDPTSQEIDSFMSLMDTNRDGVISWDEFLHALHSWIRDEHDDKTNSLHAHSNSQLSRKRKPDPDQSPANTRSKIHKRISGFFLQFKPRANFDEIRNRLAMEATYTPSSSSPTSPRASSSSFSSSSNIDSSSAVAPVPLDSPSPHPSDPHHHHYQQQHLLVDTSDVFKSYSAQEKLQALNEASELLSHLAEISVGINCNDPTHALKCTHALNTILNVLEAFRTPDERYEIGDIIVTVFKAISEAGVLARLVDFLDLNEMPELQLVSARVLGLYGAGPRIAHTPKDSLMHPLQKYHKSQVISLGGLHRIAQLIIHTNIDIRIVAVHAIALLASYDGDVRDLLISMGVYKALYEQIVDDIPLPLLTQITFALAIFCGHTHTTRPSFNSVSGALNKFSYLIQIEPTSESVVTHVFLSLSFLLPGTEIQVPQAAHLCRFLFHPSHKIQASALSCITTLIRVDPICIPVFVQAGLLSSLRELLVRSGSSGSGGGAMSASDVHPLRLDACECLLLIAHDTQSIQNILEAELMPILLSLLKTDELIRWKAIKVVKALTRGLPIHIIYMVSKLDIIRVLSASFAHFKSYDTILKDVYKFVGASYNFELVHDVCHALNSIIECGGDSAIDTLSTQLDLDTVDRIRDVMNMLSSELADQMDAWRNITEPGITSGTGLTLEYALPHLLTKIRAIHEHVNLPDISIHVVNAVNEALNTFNTNMKKNKSVLEKRRKQKINEVTKGSSGPAVIGGMNIETSSASSSSSAAAFSASIFPSSSSSSSSSSSLSSGEMIQLKLYFNGDNRVLDVPRDILLRDLIMRVQLKYGRSLILQYEDDDLDKITIDSQEVVNRAFNKIEGGGATGITPTLKLHLQAKGLDSTSSTSGTPSPFAYTGSSGASSGSSLFDRFKKMENVNTSNGGVYQSRHELLNELQAVTKFNKKSLENLYKQFQRSSSYAKNGGKWDKTQFAQGVSSLGFNDPVLIDQLFNAFDFDKDGFIDFRDFACGLSVLYKGDLNEKLELAFKAYDLDGNGVIDRDELFHILKSSFTAKGFYQSDDHIRALVEKSFDDADVDGNGQLDFEEFKNAVVKHQIVVQSFWRNSPP